MSREIILGITEQLEAQARKQQKKEEAYVVSLADAVAKLVAKAPASAYASEEDLLSISLRVAHAPFRENGMRGTPDRVLAAVKKRLKDVHKMDALKTLNIPLMEFAPARDDSDLLMHAICSCVTGCLWPLCCLPLGRCFFATQIRVEMTFSKVQREEPVNFNAVVLNVTPGAAPAAATGEAKCDDSSEPTVVVL